MTEIAPDVIALLQYLVPGFLAAWVFYGLTCYEKPSEWERIVQALIFTLFVRAFVGVEKAISIWCGHYALLGSWNDLSAATLTALGLGVLFSYFANKDILHRMLRSIGVTIETSYPSEWFSAFSSKITYVVLHLKDERRAFGWPREWPSSPRTGHFLLEQPGWMIEKKYVPAAGVTALLIDVEDVRWVEFIEKFWETRNAEEGIEPTTPYTPA